MTDILVFCEVDGGRVKKSARELLGKAKELADGGTVSALLFGADLGGVGAELGTWGADKVLKAEHAHFGAYIANAWGEALKQVVEAQNPDVVLAAASQLGKDLLPRAAALLDAGVGADVIDLRNGDDGVEGTRVLYSGKCRATVQVEGSPKFFSVRPNSFLIDSIEGGAADVEDASVDLEDDVGYEVVEVERTGGTKVELTEAERIISGGRSLGSAEAFGIFNDISASLGAAVGASRAAVDAGFCSHSMQVGQTGKTVNPALYIACGISGAIQHLAGMRTSKVIVAINKDKDAPIFQHATYGIVGDLFEVVPALTAEVKALLAE